MDPITITVAPADATQVIERAGGWKDGDGRYHFGGGAAEHFGPFNPAEALRAAIVSIAAGAALDA